MNNYLDNYYEKVKAKQFLKDDVIPAALLRENIYQCRICHGVYNERESCEHRRTAHSPVDVNMFLTGGLFYVRRGSQEHNEMEDMSGGWDQCIICLKFVRQSHIHHRKYHPEVECISLSYKSITMHYRDKQQKRWSWVNHGSRYGAVKEEVPLEFRGLD